ncbi:MAG: hypothetical protein ACK5IP_21525 [Paracoccus sp. (in: a-proteobacteria)]
MLYPTAGSRIYIADAPVEAPGTLPASGWVEIGEAEALGLLGVEWGIIDATHMDSRGGEEEMVKAILHRQPMQIVFGQDPEDAGQAILWRASRSRRHFPFRLVFQGGAHWRAWFGLVTGLSEVFDTANSIMKLQADILPSSQTYRSEGT